MLRCLIPGLLVLLAAGQASAAVLTFDDLPEGAIPDGYGGLNWDGIYVANTSGSLSNSGYGNSVQSGTNVAYNAWGYSVSTSGSSFDFNGAYLGAAWNDGLSVLVQGYSGGSLAYSETVSVDTSGSSYFNFGFFGVDELRFSSSGGVNAGYNGYGVHFAMDNFTYNEPAAATSVPELDGNGAGSALALVLGGAMVLGSSSRRRRRA